MYIIEIEDIENNKVQFEDLHKKNFVSSSEIATVCGLGWNTPLELWAIKTGRKVVDFTAQADTLWMGHQLEPVAAKLFERKTGHTLTRVNQVWRSESIPFAICSPDYIMEGLDGRKAIVEIKTTAHYNEHQWSETKAPDHAHCQLMWQLGVSGFETYGYCAGLVGGDARKFFHPKFGFDAHIFEAMVKKAERFVDLVRTDTPPEITGADKNNVLSIFGTPKENIVKELDSSATALIKKFEELKLQRTTNENAVETINKEMDDIKMKLWSLTDNHSMSIAGEYVVVCKKVTRKPYTTKESSWFEVRVKRGRAELTE